MLPAAACGGDAQGGSTKATGRATEARRRFDPKTYALDEGKVRKVAAVMRAWDPKGPEPSRDDPNAYVDTMARMRKAIDFENKVVVELTEHSSTATIESVPELKAAIAREGLSPREFAEMYLAYKTAEGHLMVTGLGQLAGAVAGTSGPTPPQAEPKPSGVFAANVELIQRMDKEEELPSWW